MNRRKLEIYVGAPKDQYPWISNSFSTLYEGDTCNNPNKTILGFSLINEQNQKDRPGYSGEILLKNVRAFIEDLKNKNKTGKGSYFLECKGAKNYSRYSKGDVIGECLICGGVVKAETSFLVFIDKFDEKSAWPRKQSYDTIHGDKCLQKFIDRIETTIEETDNNTVAEEL